jgi:CheY-like chemotaxis protein/anti-sigma regulatory factor (Ser/Thr protein kinase)
LAEQLAAHDLAVTVEVPDREAKIPEEQAVLLFQSVRELLMNVAKHAGCREAAVRLNMGQGMLRIQVRDHGKGFDPAAAASSSAAIKSVGTAPRFGLFSIRERMRAMQGAFEIQSEIGRGTMATLTLPLSLSAAEARGERIEARGTDQVLSQPGGSLPLASHRSPLASTKIRVLLVDDHAMVRQGLRTLLDSYVDIEVVGEASDGEEAVAAAGRLRPHITVMDINMPKKNGIEATAEIKRRVPETVVIGLSVNAGGESQRAMIAAGAVMLLTKEAAVDRLYAAILDVMKSSDRARHREQRGLHDQV